MTIEQVKTDIASGKSTTIYYSTCTLWWTHLDEDVELASLAGRLFKSNNHLTLMARHDIPATEKKRLEDLYDLAQSNSIPLDPTGAPLFMMGNPKKWVDEAEKKPEHFGGFGLQAFMKAHHQNCGGQCAHNWNFYNILIEKEKTNK